MSGEDVEREWRRTGTVIRPEGAEGWERRWPRSSTVKRGRGTPREAARKIEQEVQTS